MAAGSPPWLAVLALTLMSTLSAGSLLELSPSESSQSLSRQKRAAPPCYPCHGVSGACFHGWQACDGNRQCPGGEDEANCVHPELGHQYARRDDRTLLRGAGRRIFFTGISLQGCGMVCSHMEPDCRAFTYTDREPTRACTLYTRPGKSYESVGTMLYERQAPPDAFVGAPAEEEQTSASEVGPPLTLLGQLFVVEEPEVTEPVELDLAPLARVGSAAKCASADAYQCSAEQCIPAWHVCDGSVECVGGSEEKLCKSLARAFEEADEPRPASRRLARPPRVKSRAGCAAACLWHWTGGRACTGFVFDGSNCELGCLDCGGDGKWLDGRRYEQLAPLAGMAALFDQLQPLPEAERGMALRAMYRIGSVVTGHDALGDQKFDLQGNNEINSFDSSDTRLTTPALPPNVLQRTGGKLVQGKYRTTVVGYMYTSRQEVRGSVVPMYVTGASISFTNPALADSNLATRIRTTRTSRRHSTKGAKNVAPTPPAATPVEKTALPFDAPPRTIESSSAAPPPPPTTTTPRPRTTTTTPRPPPPPEQRVAVQPALSSGSPAPAADGFGAPLGETPTCGRRPVDDAMQTRSMMQTLRVVGGSPANYGKYPWQAQLLAFNSSSGQFEHQCGAVIISAHHLLTAAHCATGGPRLRALVGVSDRSRPDEPERQAFDVANAVTHPQYLAGPHGSYTDDIAVVRIRGPGIRFSAYVQPLCLPRGGGAGHAGQMCQISGWGRREFDSPSEAELQLRGASVPIVSDPFCSTREVHGQRFRPGKMVCAGALSGGTDSCQGDSGGPLACADKNGRWTAVGIVSYGVGCGIINKPGVYTKVQEYVDWIDGVMRFV